MYPKNEPEWQKQAIKDLAKKYGIDIRVVRQMVYYPFLFTKESMKNIYDKRPIRHMHLGVFLLRKRHERYFDEHGQLEVRVRDESI